MLYSRNINEKFTIKSDDEKKAIIVQINNQIFKQSLFKCISLVTAISPNDEILLRGLVCRNEDSGQIQIFNVSGSFPGLRVQNLDGSIVGTVIFEEDQFVTSHKDGIVEEIIITPTIDISENSAQEEDINNESDLESTKLEETIESSLDDMVKDNHEEFEVIKSDDNETTVVESNIDTTETDDAKQVSEVNNSEKQSTPRRRGRRKKV